MLRRQSTVFLSKKPDFSSAQDETILFDTGLTVSIIGEKIAKNNNLVIKNLTHLITL